MSTLYELTAEYQQLLEMAEDPGEDSDAITGSMDAIGGEIEDKLDGYGRVIANLSADVDAIDAEIARLTARKKTITNNISHMERVMQYSMEAQGKEKIKTTLFSFSIRNLPARVVLDTDDIEKIPDEYLVVKPAEVSKTKIKDALKAGKDLTGIAHLEQGRKLTIR